MAASGVQYQGIRVARELQGSVPSPMLFNIYMKPLGMIVRRYKAGFRQLSVFLFLFSHGALVPVISSSLDRTINLDLVGLVVGDNSSTRGIFLALARIAFPLKEVCNFRVLLDLILSQVLS